MSRHARSRRGAALIIALVILAGLLMLGLPFLFTQSSSLTGTRSFAHNQQAHLSDDAAENIGIDVVGTALSFHYSSTGTTPQPTTVEEYTSLYWSLKGGEYDALPHLDPATQTGTAVNPTPNHVHLDIRQLGLDPTTRNPNPVAYPTFPDLVQPGRPPGPTPPQVGAVSTLGLAVEDESGKLNPNYLDALSWATLLSALHIVDTAAGQQGAGDLALALAQLHNPPNSAYPGLGHITYLEQLLSAVPPARASARGGLTRAEFETLRPLLSLAGRAMGRAGPRIADVMANTSTPYLLSGARLPNGTSAQPVAAETLTLIDLGTLLSAGGALHFDSVSPARMLANPVTPVLVGAGSTLVVEDKGTTDSLGNPLQIEHVLPYNQAAVASAGLAANMPAAIAAPPALNLLQAAPAVLQVLDGFTIAPPTPPATANLHTPAPDSMAGPSGLVNPAMVCSQPAIYPPGAPAAQQNAFVLLNPLFSSAVLGTGRALPTTASDLVLAPGALTISGPTQTYAAANDPANQLRPALLANVGIIHVQVAALTALPPSGWAVLYGGQRADNTGLTAQPEYIYYNALTIDDAANGLGTLNVFAGRGLTWANNPSVSTSVFADPIPPLARVPASPIPSIAFFAAHELPAPRVNSPGVVTVESSATITDPSGRQVAQRSRRVITQALPQEALLEERWLTQGQIHALLASRQGSLMTSFPRPYPRLSDQLPSDADPLAVPNHPDSAVGMRPSTLRTLQSSIYLPRDWSLPLAGSTQTFQTAQLGAGPAAYQAAATGVPGTYSWGRSNIHPLGAITASMVTPEGLVCTSSTPGVYLAFPVLSPDGGPFGMSNAPVAGSNTMRNAEIPPRQFSFWIKPTQVWNGIVPLLEMRMPVANTGLPLSGVLLPAAAPAIDGRFAQGGTPPAAPDTSLQNYLALSYDGSVSGQEQLVLTFANGAIEHRLDYGPLITPDAGNPRLDTRSYMAPAGTPNATALAPARPWNDIEFRYLYPLKPDCWHLVQVCYLRDTPGAQTIIVDGLVGRDITRSGSLAMSAPGDHLTLPSLVLGADLAAIPLPATTAAASAAALAVATLPVSCWLPRQGGAVRGADQLLPRSGYVRIGDEYLSYQGISPTVVVNGVATSNLLGVMRGQRQNTVAQGPLVPNAWPTIPAHAQGDLVVPGGYRLASNAGFALLSGGCALAALNPATTAGFWQGDADLAKNYLLWGALMPSDVGDNVPGSPPGSTPYIDPTTMNPVLFTAPALIRMTPATSEPWPIRGYAKVVNLGSTIDLSQLASPAGPNGSIPFNGMVFYYDNTANPPPGPSQPFLNVVSALFKPGTAGAWPSANIQLPAGSNYAVVMVSCEIDCPAGSPLTALSASPTQPGNYLAGAPSPYQAPQLIQFYNQLGDGSGADTGDVEWMNYHWLTAAPIAPAPGAPPGAIATYPAPALASQYFLVNFAGFPWYGADQAGNQRGMQRTHGPLDQAGNVETYLAGTRVLPVQTYGLGVVRTGDVLTIAPAVCPAGPAPTYAYGPALATTASCWQAVVRYSPTDGFGNSGGPSPVLTDDTNNNYFAFTEALPLSFAPGTYDLLCWPCWNGKDLSPTSWSAPAGTPTPPQLISGVASLLPWSNVFASGFLQAGSSDDRVTYIGATDDRPAHNPLPVAVMEGEIDAISSGPPPGQNVIGIGTTVAGVLGADGVTVTPTAGAPWTVDGSGSIVPAPMAPWLSATASITPGSPLTIQPSVAAQLPSTGYGLVQIGGEVFPYQYHIDASTGKVNPAYIDLIGRSLLGSPAGTHRGAEPVVFPPIGPVALLAGTLAQSYQGALQLAPVPGSVPPTPPSAIDAPALLISSLDGVNMELIAAPDGLTAPWLRGLYGTCPPEFATDASAPAWSGALVIAWWPRYPSALPNASANQWTRLTAAQQAAMLRCRTYAWAGFPLRFYDALFASGGRLGSLGYVTLLDDAKVMNWPLAAGEAPTYGPPTFDLGARALASGFDWVQMDNAKVPPLLPEIPFPPSAAAGSAPAGTDISDAFNSAQFPPGATVDGAELRVLWRYHAPYTTTAIDLVGLANLCNRAPTLGQAKLRCLAPAKIISVESAR